MFFIEEVLSCGIFLLFLDITIPTHRKHKWVLIHSIINWFIVCFTIGDTWNYFMCPTCIHSSENAYAMVYVLLLHIYHTLCYTCNCLDYIHHFVMCSLLGIPLYSRFRNVCLYEFYPFFYLWSTRRN